MQQMRQQGQSEKDLEFQSGLSNLHQGAIMMDDWQFKFQSQVMSNLPRRINSSFEIRSYYLGQMEMSMKCI